MIITIWLSKHLIIYKIRINFQLQQEGQIITQRHFYLTKKQKNQILIKNFKAIKKNHNIQKQKKKCQICVKIKEQKNQKNWILFQQIDYITMMKGEQQIIQYKPFVHKKHLL
ncbi:hypothetical protein IMG5_171270 [Ichthyophthirius multifiliis]|uniref:Uncharacterized protein n=1 Tax=Ichthyophthirius multifiliis TaxID=5932 RepID=G0R1L5_ICHMU|nr:hypothetical protein IMG5_171270 [Ichthyophthirius multifiliis]EGR28644.1 hypothetical protein IMG5_171270 [Ichthyophthirius multifiliis]|eukprot:XP_004029880.1 hypothetical protein IMG5_171270 [Ichthyophthirius multifiliis]